jgi:LL-diaminopimelate aminotransferase
VRLSQRLTQVPPYLFAQLDARKAAVVARGVDVIPLGIGDPDLSTPEPIIAEMRQAIKLHLAGRREDGQPPPSPRPSPRQ